MLPEPPSPGLGGEESGPRNTKSDKQEVSFHDPGGSNSEEEDDSNILVTMMEAEQLTTPGRRRWPRHWAQRGRAPRRPEALLLASRAQPQSRLGPEPKKRKGRGGSFLEDDGKSCKRGRLEIPGAPVDSPAKQQGSKPVPACSVKP